MTKTYVMLGRGRCACLLNIFFFWKIKPILRSCWRERESETNPSSYWMNAAVSASPFPHCYVPVCGVGFQRVTRPRQSQTYFLSAPKIEIAPPDDPKGTETANKCWWQMTLSQQYWVILIQSPQIFFNVL